MEKRILLTADSRIRLNVNNFNGQDSGFVFLLTDAEYRESKQPGVRWISTSHSIYVTPRNRGGLVVGTIPAGNYWLTCLNIPESGFDIQIEPV